MKRRSFFSHLLEVICYIAYTVSVYYMSHLIIGGDIVIDDRYRMFSIIFIMSTFFYFRNENVEILKEILKSGFILIFCQLIDAFFFEDLIQAFGGLRDFPGTLTCTDHGLVVVIHGNVRVIGRHVSQIVNGRVLVNNIIKIVFKSVFAGINAA